MKIVRAVSRDFYMCIQWNNAKILTRHIIREVICYHHCTDKLMTWYDCVVLGYHTNPRWQNQDLTRSYLIDKPIIPDPVLNSWPVSAIVAGLSFSYRETIHFYFDSKQLEKIQNNGVMVNTRCNWVWWHWNWFACQRIKNSLDRVGV